MTDRYRYLIEELEWAKRDEKRLMEQREQKARNGESTAYHDSSIRWARERQADAMAEMKSI